MKLDERDEQQSEGDKQTEGNREILREKKSAEAKNPRHHDHDVELACGVRFQNLDRRQHNNEGNAGLDSPERAVAKEQQGQDQGHENQFPNQGAKRIPFGSIQNFAASAIKNSKGTQDGRLPNIGGNVKSNAAASHKSGRRGMRVSCFRRTFI